MIYGVLSIKEIRHFGKQLENNLAKYYPYRIEMVTDVVFWHCQYQYC